MPVTLKDASLRTAYRALERQVGTGAASLDDLKKILSSIADRGGLTMTRART